MILEHFVFCQILAQKATKSQNWQRFFDQILIWDHQSWAKTCRESNYLCFGVCYRTEFYLERSIHKWPLKLTWATRRKRREGVRSTLLYFFTCNSNKIQSECYRARNLMMLYLKLNDFISKITLSYDELIIL